MMRCTISLALVAASLLAQRTLSAQDRGATALGELVRGLGVNARVLVIGAHPDDEDTQLITWLARGHQVETAYLSLTRGDGGQNLIGNELGEALGAIRTEELLAARRIDGGHQYFTRAYDFGFSKSAEETYKHWPKDSILRDVVTVVRAFKPHVIVAIFSGTARDGHGHHQVSGQLAREAYEIAGDTTRMPRSMTRGYGAWQPLKFYRRVRAGTPTTLRINVGEYSPLRGRSYAELAAESRSQHKSQAFGSLQPKGEVIDELGLEASPIYTAPRDAYERAMFMGFDTAWTRLRSALSGRALSALDSMVSAIDSVQRSYDPFAPERLIAPLGRIRRLALGAMPCPPHASAKTDPGCRLGANTALSDVEAALAQLVERTDRALALASGVAVDATVDHETWAAGEPIVLSVTAYNRADVLLRAAATHVRGADTTIVTGGADPGSSIRFRDTLLLSGVTQPAWLARPRHGDLFSVPITATPEDRRHDVTTTLDVNAGGVSFAVVQPIVYRYADPIKGEIQHPIAVVPAVSVTVDEPVQFVAADQPFDRVIRVELRSASNHARTVRVSLQLPRGLSADSASRTIGLPDYSGSFGADDEPRGLPGGRRVTVGSPSRIVEFRVRGTLAQGRHPIAVVAESEGQRYTTGYTLIDYDHIRPQRLFHDATVSLSAVSLRVAPGLNVAYVPGVGDNVAPMLQQLGVPLTIIEPDKVAAADLSKYTTVVVGPRAYESSPSLVAANARLIDFTRRGGTLVVQYGQFEMANPGIMPYPITFARPADRVTEEDAPVRLTDPSSPLLSAPNRISAADWDGWVQERSLYMARTHDVRYKTILSVNDAGEPPNDGAILVAPVGKGTYVYTTLALFRQLPAGVPGAARLFVNLLSADQRSAGPNQPPPKP